ncbi:MAG: toxin-antitoxin system HicB family antitoxin [Thermodesulfobacteriota bacterium]|nr:toxin-antitoxin system HicB family antitoxin [Thermodesulfobacteriota bacterium]
MTEILIRLPDRLHQKICEISGKQNIPVDEIIAASVAERLFRLMPDSYLEERAKRSTGKGLSDVLSQVPDVPPEEYDRL